MDLAAVSSNARRHDQPFRHDPACDGVPNLVDQDRIRREAEGAAQQAVEQAAQRAAYQSFPVYPMTSVEAGVTARPGGVPCLVPAQ